MRRSCVLITFLIVVLIIACDGDTAISYKQNTEPFLFEDGFETLNNTLEELFPSDASRWSNVQQSDATLANNEISISSARSSEGEDALRIVAYKSDSLLSKMDIEKSGLKIQSGDQVTISADFYITGTESLENLFLIDLECCSCWDPSVDQNSGAENQCPGIRLMISSGNDFLSIERGKIVGSTLSHTATSFPRNQWVSVIWQMTISDDDNGQNILIINGEEVINQNAMNLPNAEVFKTLFADAGIEFELQQPTIYERVQIGATANASNADVEMYVDNFYIRVEK